MTTFREFMEIHMPRSKFIQFGESGPAWWLDPFDGRWYEYRRKKKAWVPVRMVF